jgi:uncharacterized protein YdbL (DUF1318 family)
MRRSIRLLCLALAGAGGLAWAAEPDASARLRATGLVGEQYDGYLAVVERAPAAIRADMEAVNIKRRASYTQVAAARRVNIDEVGAAMACEILATRILPGQYYRLPDGNWRRRLPGQPVMRPAYCPPS